MLGLDLELGFGTSTAVVILLCEKITTVALDQNDVQMSDKGFLNHRPQRRLYSPFPATLVASVDEALGNP